MNEQTRTKISVVIVTFNRRADVLRCVESIIADPYPQREIIVVDNASEDGTAAALTSRFGTQIHLIAAPTNLNAAGGRNLGAKHATGEFLLFIDSDNIVLPTLSAKLAALFESHDDCGMAGCIMAYAQNPAIVWTGGGGISLATSRTQYLYAGRPAAEITETREYCTGHLPNLFMVRRGEFNALGGFFEPYGIMFEESDLAERIRRGGKKIYVVPEILDLHDQPILADGSLRSYGLHTPQRARAIARNRNIFMLRNAPLRGKLLYFLFFLPLFTAYYLQLILRKRGGAAIFFAYLSGALTFRTPRR